MKEQRTGSKPESAQDQPISFFQRMIGLIAGVGDLEREKHRILRTIAKNLKRVRGKYYTPKSGHAEHDLASLFYDLYRVFGPAQSMLKVAESSAALKHILVESALTQQQLAARERLSEEALRKALDQKDPKEVYEVVKQDLRGFYSSFDPETVSRIDLTHLLLDQLLDLIRFDFYRLLRKFDGKLPEYDFVYKPKFEAINGEYIGEEYERLPHGAVSL